MDGALRPYNDVIAERIENGQCTNVFGECEYPIYEDNLCYECYGLTRKPNMWPMTETGMTETGKTGE